MGSNNDINLNKLVDYGNAEETFYAVKYRGDIDEYNLEIGDQIIYDSDNMSDFELEAWAISCGLLQEGEGYKDLEGNIDFSSIKALIREGEEEKGNRLSTSDTPEGRAFSWFLNLKHKIPEHIRIGIIDETCPGNNYQEVTIYGYLSLVLLQSFLKTKDIIINIIVKAY